MVEMGVMSERGVVDREETRLHTFLGGLERLRCDCAALRLRCDCCDCAGIVPRLGLQRGRCGWIAQTDVTKEREKQGVVSLIGGSAQASAPRRSRAGRGGAAQPASRYDACECVVRVSIRTSNGNVPDGCGE